MVLSKAPLIEAIFELRWGEVLSSPDSTVSGFKFTKNDMEFFAGQFRQIAAENGFTTVEAANPAMGSNPLSHIVGHRFRRSPDEWPCYQIGLGIFTVNQVNDGYTWPSYEKSISDGLRMLGSAQPGGIEGLSGIGVELRYQDGFLLDEDESPTDFLKKKMEINYSLPKEFLELENLENEPQGNRIGFGLGVNNPDGVLLLSLDQAFINGKPGFVMTTTVRSSDDNKPEFTKESLERWVTSAHNIQKHAFNTLISDKYAGSFK